MKFIHSFWRLIQCLFERLLLRGAPSPVSGKEEELGDCDYDNEDDDDGSGDDDDYDDDGDNDNAF